MRIVFMGYQAWGVRALEALISAGHQVELVVTHPPSADAYEALWNESVRALAESRRIPVVECRTANDPRTARTLGRCRPELFVMSNWRRWLRPDVYGLAPHGAINIHDALLPRYGGFAPINWAVAAGERETGVTVHVVDERLDAGDILVQKRVPIGFEDTATDIYNRTLPLFAELIVEAVAQLESGTARPCPRTSTRGRSSTGARAGSSTSTGSERRPMCTTSCARSPTRTRARSPSTAVSRWRFCRLASRHARTAERPGGSCTGRRTA